MSNFLSDEQISLFKQLPGYWGCKDLNSVFVYANDAYGRLIGVEDAKQCIGLTDFEMPSQPQRVPLNFSNKITMSSPLKNS